MAKKVKLYCNEGKHHWLRETQRGRPPLNCPKHQPEKVLPTSNGKPKLRRIKCAEGHYWKWPVRGGFEPKWCPEHKPVKEDKPEFVELWCEIGKHNWSRERKRGKQPSNCPLHHPSAKQAPKGLGAIKQQRVKTAAPTKQIAGLGKLRQRKRVGFKRLHERHLERLREEIQNKIDQASLNYEQAFDEERAVFLQLDRLEMMKLKTPKRLEKIDELRLEWERKSRRLNNMYMTLQTNIAGARRVRMSNGKVK